MFNALEVTGRARTHVIQVDAPHRFAAHPEVVSAFLEMRNDARKDGLDLLPFSSFRDYRMQLRIWNGKFSGRKPLYDIKGCPRDYASLGEDEIIDHILDWSALPGGSRHHWGTEIDVVDAAAMLAGYSPKLLPEEVEEGGVFHSLHLWLDENVGRYGFYRPYDIYRGGMYPEPWHLSYARISAKAGEDLTLDLLTEVIRDADILGRERLLERLPELYERHVLNVAVPVKVGPPSCAD